MMVYSIVVTYNGAKWVDKCFGSLVNSSIVDHRIFAIDNGSTDGTVDLIRANFPIVEIIETGSNLGFGKANNIGMRKALNDNADYVFLLNQDAWVEQDTIKKLMEISVKHPEYGILSPMQYYRPEILDYRFKKYVGRGKENVPNILDVKFVNAAAWFLTSKCLSQNGVFHEAFKHYGEDQEYCKRILYRKFKIGIIKTSVCFHDRPQEYPKMTDVLKERNAEISILMKLTDFNDSIFKGIYMLFKFLFFSKNTKGLIFRFCVFLNTLPLFIHFNKNHKV